MDKDTALRRIRKCLALSASNEPEEAAAAMRQAQKLMEQFNIEHPELQASTASHQWVKSRAKARPPLYEVHMANVLAKGFGCDLIFSQEWLSADLHGGYNFIGVAPAPEIASYTFTVLRRKLLQARADYTAIALKRYRKNKVAAADAFCTGWAVSACGKVLPAAPVPEQVRAIAAYRAREFGATSVTKGNDRAVAVKSLPDHHKMRGYIAGDKVTVQPGVGGAAAPAQLGFTGL
jgi:hypothetical protein